jgi:hypothetical protein
MQISTIKNQNLEKPSRNPSNGTIVKILKKKFFGYLSKKFGFAYAQSPRKCSNFEILAKIEGNEAKFFRKFTKGILGFDLGPKKFKNISYLCTFKGTVERKT